MEQTLNMSIENRIPDPERPLAMNPKKFALWLFIVSIIMLFAALTSAYIVRRADGNWLAFDLPPVLWINTIIILASSGTMQWAYICAKKNELDTLKLAIVTTTILGFAFLIGQFFAWNKLVEMNVFFGGSTSNPAGSFLYVLTGLHAFHLVSGIIYLLIVLSASFKYKIHSKNTVQIEMCATYWHFLDFLWVYLFIFLIINS
jgi:cytochrome c oxidase subunit 3